MGEAPSNRVVFEPAVEGLFLRALRDRLTPELRSRIRQAGIDLEQPLLPAYPVTVWVACVRTAAESLFPREPLGAAHRKLGYLLVEGYRDTLIGRAVFGVLKLIGPRRSLERTAKNFRTGNNYTEVKLVARGPAEYEMWMNESGTEPEFTAGIVEAGMKAAGAEETTVTVIDRQADSCLFRVVWKEA